MNQYGTSPKILYFFIRTKHPKKEKLKKATEMEKLQIFKPQAQKD
jgi:hypothetical protein